MKCFMDGCGDDAVAGDACVLHATHEQLAERLRALLPLTPTYVVRAKPEGDSIQDTWFTSDNFGGDPELSRIEAHQYAAQTGQRLEVRWTTPWQDEPIDRSVS